jgi:hypothetical protein
MPITLAISRRYDGASLPSPVLERASNPERVDENGSVVTSWP